MSARRRQETIARFSVPIEVQTSAPSLSQATAPPSSQPTEPETSQRSARRRGKSSQSSIVDYSIDGDQDDVYVMSDDQGDDDDFIDDDEDTPRTQKKAKGKAKGKEKAGKPKAKPSRSSSDDGVNPRVMLISLKAGALGLNLTVANNVYLYVHIHSLYMLTGLIFTFLPEWTRKRFHVRAEFRSLHELDGGRKALSRKPSTAAIGGFRLRACKVPSFAHFSPY